MFENNLTLTALPTARKKERQARLIWILAFVSRTINWIWTSQLTVHFAVSSLDIFLLRLWKIEILLISGSRLIFCGRWGLVIKIVIKLIFTVFLCVCVCVWFCTGNPFYVTTQRTVIVFWGDMLVCRYDCLYVYGLLLPKFNYLYWFCINIRD